VIPRVGLVGCGPWGRNILRDLRLEGAEVTVVDPDPSARSLALAGGAARAVAAMDELSKVDGLLVATPASTHASVLDRALERGAPVFVEKPMTTDPESAERLAARAGDRLFVMHVFRYHHGIEALAAVARDGELGPVVMLRSSRAHWGSPRTDVDSIWTLAPHDLSIALAILGSIPPPRAAMAEVVGGRAAGMVALLGHAPGFVLEVSTRSRERRREVQLRCRDGVACLADSEDAELQVWPDGAASSQRRPFPQEPPLRRQVRAFLEHLRGGPPPPTTAAEGARVVRCVWELRRLAGLED
jgi:predicted dehydrogenase